MSWRAQQAPSPRPAASSAFSFRPATHRALASARRGARPVPRKTRRIRRRWLVAGAALFGGLVFAAFTDGGRAARNSPLRLPQFDVAARWLGLGIDQVALTGHRFTLDGDVFDALELDRQRLLTSFDTGAARRRIEKLPWVDSVEITRDFPGRLGVRISERKPYAVWRHDGREYLIDQTGRVLQAVPAGSAAGVPRVAGQGADREAGALLALVSSHPPLAKAFAEAELVGGRRWRIVTSAGTRFELPAEGGALVLDALAANGELERLLALAAPHVVDLRAKGRVAVRPLTTRAATGSATASPASIASLLARTEEGPR